MLSHISTLALSVSASGQGRLTEAHASTLALWAVSAGDAVVNTPFNIGKEVHHCEILQSDGSESVTINVMLSQRSVHVPCLQIRAGADVLGHHECQSRYLSGGQGMLWQLWRST